MPARGNGVGEHMQKIWQSEMVAWGNKIRMGVGQGQWCGRMDAEELAIRPNTLGK